MYRKNKTKSPGLSSSLKPNEVDGNKNHNYTVMRFHLCGTHLTRVFNHWGDFYLSLAFTQKISPQAEAQLT